MHYRRFGRTDWSISVFSLGLMRCLANPAQLRDTLAAALAAGVNHLETARSYGESERYLGTALHQLGADRKALRITSKLVPTADGAAFRRDLDVSLERLGLDYLDGLAIHGINTEAHLADTLAPGGCLEVAEQARAEGQVGAIGFSTHGDLELVQRAIATDRFAFVCLHYYYFNPRLAPAIAAAAERDMGVFIISPADKGGLLYRPAPQLMEDCAPFEPLGLTYRWLLSDPRITTLSMGPAHPGELAAPLAWAEATAPLTAAETAALDRLAALRGERLGTSACSQCHACLPCPEAIRIPEVLRLRNLAVGHGMTEYGEYRYRMFENAGHWFPGRRGDRCSDCGDCLPRCPEELDIPTLLRETHERLRGPARRRLWGD